MYNKRGQRGAVAIEFAAIAVLFITLVCGTIIFGIQMIARFGFQHYSAEAARVAVQVDPSYLNRPATRSLIAGKIDSIIEESWVQGWSQRCSGIPDSDSGDWQTWNPLSSDYAYWREEAAPAPNRTPRYQIVVCLQANSSILLPPFNDASKVRGYTITTL